MAEGVLFDVAKGMIEKAINLAIQEIGLLWSLKDEIVKLKDTVFTISAVLLDAEEQQQHNNQVKVWLNRLKDAIYDADNLLDDISTEALRQEVMTRDKKAKKVRIFFSKSNQLAYGFKMGHKVKEMRGRLDTIAANMKFHLVERLVETQVRHHRVRETHSFVHTEKVIGREKDKEEIIRILLDPNDEESVLVLPIVGLGGSGKTTLAQLVFNDKEIKKHFERKMWVCVSENFDVKIIVEKILESAKNKKLETLGMDTLIINLKEEIDEKRYLLVLDDVWNEDLNKWYSLKDILKSGARGSKIIVTTRSNKVAMNTQTVPPYMLEGLDEKESWSLFKQMAFERGQEPENSKFKEIGKEILKKCRGVPLAIKTIGSLLYFKNTEIEWLSFKDSELSKIPQKENDILPTLKLSYDHLPSYLKQCFAYCCLFPKDYKIHKPTLIQMWMAQGYIRPLNQNQCLEDVGHEYIMDLLWRSFFQEVEKDEGGNILQFKMHDLMHDLAKLVAGSYSTTCKSKEEIIDEKTLHVSFVGQSWSQIPDSLYRASRIRTFLLLSESHDSYTSLGKSTCNAIISSFNFICLLDLHDMGIRTIPDSIGKLRYLRYLDLSYNSIEMLPNSITGLLNLQTLRLFGCLIKKLPKDINKLVQLRYLEMDVYWPGQLTEISKNSCLASFRRNVELKAFYKLNKFRGSLRIWGLRHGKDTALKSKDLNMKEKKYLQDLTLSWIEEDVDESNVGYDESSLEALHPHAPGSNLQQLSLIRYGGVKFPSGISSLSTLVKFSLNNCSKCQYLPPLNQFQSLKSLSLTSMNNLDYISERDNREFSGSSFLPSLQQLQIKYCLNLKGWWQRQTESDEEFHNHSFSSLFPRLSNLEIWGCLQLKSMPLFPYLEKLDLRKCSLKPLEQTIRMENLKSIAATSASSSSTPATSSFIPLSKLKNLLIGYMEQTLPKELMCNLISLQDLTIKSCCGTLPLSRHLTALQNLTVRGSEEVDLRNDGDEMEWHGLQSLRYLQFWDLPNLATLPVGIQHLTSLQRIQIVCCPRLSAIPEWICELTKLKTLDIWGCPILSKRCEREAGEDWNFEPTLTIWVLQLLNKSTNSLSKIGHTVMLE